LEQNELKDEIKAIFGPEILVKIIDLASNNKKNGPKGANGTSPTKTTLPVK
jgi:hypothetical protein